MSASPSPAVTARLAPSFLPATGVLEMTYRCNHECLFCSCPWEAPAGGFERLPELSVEEWKDAIRRITSMGVCSLAFTGGEPLLKAGLFEIVTFASHCLAEHIETEEGALVSHQAPPKLYLLSNGTAVDRHVLEFCRDHGVQLSMSLPGLGTLNEHTGIGDPDIILSRFREAHAMGLKTVANVTVTRRNLPELYQTLSAALLAGAQQVLLNRFLPGGRGLRHAAELSLNAEEIRRMLDTAEEVLAAAGRFGSLGTEIPKCIVDATKYKRITVGTRCSAALQFFVIDPSGYVRVCNHSTVRLEHVSEIEKVKNNPYWRRFTQKDYLPSRCSGCGMISDCDGGCREAAHIHGGAVDAPDPVLSH